MGRATRLVNPWYKSSRSTFSKTVSVSINQKFPEYKSVHYITHNWKLIVIFNIKRFALIEVLAGILGIDKPNKTYGR